MGKNVIYVYGGWKGHKPAESVDLMVPKLRAEGANVKVFDTLSVYTDDKLMAETDLIIQIWTMGDITKEQFKGLEKAVMNGTGFSGWHGGLGDAFRDNLKYQFMVGGQFVFHPGGNIDHSIKIIDKSDPITRGLNDFDLKKTEQYYMLIDPNIKVLAISEFEREKYQKPGKEENKITGSTMPVVWKKYYGKGRIFHSSIGHHLTDFDVPEVMTMQMRGFRWASEGKYAKKEHTITPIYNQ
jgi:type 1 glutamine amidotransferase